MKVYPPRDTRPFVMYCVNGKPRSSLLIESTDSMKRVFGEHVRRRLDARGGKKTTIRHTHTHMRDNHSNDNNKIIQSAEAHTFNIYCTYICKTAQHELIKAGL